MRNCKSFIKFKNSSSLTSFLFWALSFSVLNLGNNSHIYSKDFSLSTDVTYRFINPSLICKGGKIIFLAGRADVMVKLFSWYSSCIMDKMHSLWMSFVEVSSRLWKLNFNGDGTKVMGKMSEYQTKFYVFMSPGLSGLLKCVVFERKKSTEKETLKLEIEERKIVVVFFFLFTWVTTVCS